MSGIGFCQTVPCGQQLGICRASRSVQPSPQGRSDSGHAHRPASWTVGRSASTLHGREDEVKAVLESLVEHGAAVIWGGPGEGKTAVAMEAAEQLHENERELSAFRLDMQGELGCSVLTSASTTLCC